MNPDEIPLTRIKADDSRALKTMHGKIKGYK